MYVTFIEIATCNKPKALEKNYIISSNTHPTWCGMKCWNRFLFHVGWCWMKKNSGWYVGWSSTQEQANPSNIFKSFCLKCWMNSLRLYSSVQHQASNIHEILVLFIHRLLFTNSYLQILSTNINWTCDWTIPPRHRT